MAALLAVVVAVLLLLSCSKKSTDNNDNAQDEWTIMMYGAGNNNLDGQNNNTSYIVQDVQDMEKVGSQAGMNIIAMVSSLRLAGGAKYYKIELHPSENPDQISSPVLENKGTKDMSDPATLVEFMNYCKEHYPANRYLLLLDDHGAGWPGSCSDDLGGAGSLLTMTELKNAIAQSTIGHVDIVTFHACLMAMTEVAYELKGVANYLTACQFTMPMENVLGSDLWLAWIRDNQSASSQEVATHIVQSVIQRAIYKQKTTHYAAIKLSELTNLGAKVGTLSNILSTEGAQHWNEVVDAWTHTNTTQYDNPAYCDLKQYVNLLKQEPSLQNINLVVAACDSVNAAVNAAVPYTEATFQNGDPVVTRGGLNIHFPRNLQEFDSANYVHLDFHGTNWQSFLSHFVREAGAGDPVGRCCYNNNTQCGVGTQAECNAVSGTWTQGVDCSGQNPCGGGGDPTGRCCYNNNQNCGVGTQAECNAVSGQWTQGLDCNTPCQQGGSCPTVCEQAQLISLGQTVNCTFPANVDNHFFAVPVNNANYRFQLCGFSDPNDFDLYLIPDCSSNPFPDPCRGIAVGCEDFVCGVQGQGNLGVIVNRYAGSGSYQLLVTQAEPPLREPSFTVSH